MKRMYIFVSVIIVVFAFLFYLSNKDNKEPVKIHNITPQKRDDATLNIKELSKEPVSSNKLIKKRVEGKVKRIKNEE